MHNIILLLRGHIRNSFKDNNLLNFVKKLQENYNLKIYIHTWNIYSSNISWRPIKQNNNTVTKNDIMIYFYCVNKNIISLTIDDDKHIELIGDTNGNLFSTKLPKIAWKRMWYGIFTTIEKIKQNESEDILIINTRFDIFNNSNSFEYNEIYSFLESAINKKLTKNEFVKDSTKLIGVDNFYIGNINNMYLLANEFYNNLDELNNKYVDIFFQEVVVFYENNRLFLNNEKDIYENIELYKKPKQIEQPQPLKEQQYKEIPKIQEESIYKKMILNSRNILKNSSKKITHTVSNWGSFGKN